MNHEACPDPDESRDRTHQNFFVSKKKEDINLVWCPGTAMNVPMTPLHPQRINSNYTTSLLSQTKKKQKNLITFNQLGFRNWKKTERVKETKKERP